MRTSSQQRIDTLTAAGHWGHETLHGLLAKHATQHPNKLAFKDQPNREFLTDSPALELSWADAHRAVNNLAISLRKAGIGEDERVIIQMPNVVELVLMYFAVSKLGAIVSPVPVQYGRHELQNIASALDAQFLISLNRFNTIALAETAKTALPDVTVLTLNDDITLDFTSPIDEQIQWPADDANRTITVCWTSGTTGTPKGVERSHNMWMASGQKSLDAASYSENEVLLNPFPLVNMAALGGFLYPTAILGCSMVLHHPIDVPVYLKQLQTEKITFTLAPPALLNQLAKSEDMWAEYDFSALRAVGSGSAPLSPMMIETFDQQYGKPVTNYYGSNEGIALYSTPQSAPAPVMRASVFALPQKGDAISTKIVSIETGKELRLNGERGELLISGSTVFDGYLNTNNDDVFTDDGYFRTGDLVELMDDDGQSCKIVGRCKDIINRGGMKISPVELDIAIEQHTSLVEAAVCGYPDERLNEKICACIVMKPGLAPLSLKAINAFLLEQGFAKFKLPERLQILDRLPRNALAKVQRFTLEDIVAKKIHEEAEKTKKRKTRV